MTYATHSAQQTAAPGKPLRIRRGDSLAFLGAFKECGEAYPLEGGYTLAAWLTPEPSRPSVPPTGQVIPISAELTGPAEGLCRISATPTQTQALNPGRYRMLVKLTTPGGEITTSNGTFLEVFA